MAAIKNLNPKAEIAKSHQALAINIGAARGLRDVMKTNLGKYSDSAVLVKIRDWTVNMVSRKDTL